MTEWRVEFQAIEVEAETEEEALRIAAKRISLDPSFYSRYVEPLKGDLA